MQFNFWTHICPKLKTSKTMRIPLHKMINGAPTGFTSALHDLILTFEYITK